MFKLGIYSKQLTTIMVCLAFLCIGQLASCVNKAFEPTTQETLVKSVNSSDAPIIEDGYTIHIQDNGDKFILKDGDRVVHVFDRAYHPECELFKAVDRDNW